MEHGISFYIDKLSWKILRLLFSIFYFFWFTGTVSAVSLNFYSLFTRLKLYQIVQLTTQCLVVLMQILKRKSRESEKWRQDFYFIFFALIISFVAVEFSILQLTKSTVELLTEIYFYHFSCIHYFFWICNFLISFYSYEQFLKIVGLFNNMLFFHFYFQKLRQIDDLKTKQKEGKELEKNQVWKRNLRIT